ncbi:extracellular solute-binding protein [Kibdelosporangium phytohabitans]|uniref:Sugar ABC transporter substrate-binding protein n=1 Tax=Kibdelosporangium phytohabitans TaxID=860235 RepID=A0A0N9I0S7_9PSEU|nr:extracellular solute-binding protein [Kibdelosporangium phytohabitans]ALG09268.1 sugar ABC transporter substrate-binding protein [Kibdelosporangium phytohabitans]MBE1469485.1 alpha-1,4-digalacturonate transport system substrate-binding protein [Kibdelosporangium phytohabitans]
MRRSLGLIIGAALCVLAGCAPGTTDSSGGNGSAPNKLTYVYFTDGPDEQTTRALIKQFEQETGATVELQILPFAELEQQLQGRIASNNAPDVARVHVLPVFEDALLDLKSAGQDIGGQYLDAAQDYIHGDGGALVAVPSDLTMNGPFINVDQFTKAGVAPPSADKPWTWDELVTAARKVQQANGKPFAIAYDKSGHRVSGMFNQFGTNLFGTDGKVDFDPAKARRAVGRFVELTQQGVMSKDFWLESGTKYKGANDIFLTGDAPVYFSGNWQVSQFAKDAKFQWAAAPNPCAARCGGYPGGKFMAAFKQSANPRLAAKFVAFMNSRPAQEKFAKEAKFLPTRKDLVAEGVQYPDRSADMAMFLADVKRTDPGSYASNYSPGFSPTATAVVKELAAAVAGQQSVDDTVAKIRAAAEKNLEVARK